VARAHQLASLHLFGSAVRTDFRPDSYFYVFVSHREGVRPSLDSLIGLEHDYGNVDLDIVHESSMSGCPASCHRLTTFW